MSPIGGDLVTPWQNPPGPQVGEASCGCPSRTDIGGRDDTRHRFQHPRSGASRLVIIGLADGSPTNDAPEGIYLRHGSGFTIRGTKLVFQREEFADQSPVAG